MEYFLNSGKTLILDMGLGGDIIDGDSTDLTIFARNYKTQDTSYVLVEISLSNDTTSSWEILGFIQNMTEFDISSLNADNYRYIKISNYSDLPSPTDSVGIFLDAVVSLHDSLLIVDIGNKEDLRIIQKYKLYQNCHAPT